MKNQSFTEWSEAFKEARKKIGECDLVVKLFKEPIPPGWKREVNRTRKEIWDGETAKYRSRKDEAKLTGEKAMEHRLFNAGLLSIYRGKKSYPFVPVYHRLPLTGVPGGQVIPDVMGTGVIEGRSRTLMVEIKDASNDLWFAIVENLQQIRLARQCRDQIVKHFSEKFLPVGDAAWGLVLAPPSFWAKNTKRFAECKELLARLKKTQARIACASYRNDTRHIIEIRQDLSNWSSK